MNNESLRSQKLELVDFQETVGVVPIESARYIDKLPEKHEANWQEIVRLTKESNELTYDVMERVWENEQLPQAYRDRALLVIKGDWPISELLGFDSIRDSWFAGFRPKETNKPTIEAWMREVFDFQTEKGLPLLRPSTLLLCGINYFETGQIDQKQFEKALSWLDVMEAQPKFCHEDYEYDLPRDRFPLIDDIFSAEIGSPGNEEILKEWASNSLLAWLNFKADPNKYPEPSWLANTAIDDWHATKAFELLFNKKRRDDEKYLIWEHFAKAVEIFGWGTISNRLTNQDFGRNLADSMGILESIAEPTLQKKAILMAVSNCQRIRAEHKETEDEWRVRYWGWAPNCFNKLIEVRDSLDPQSPEYLMLDNELQYAAQAKRIHDIEREQSHKQYEREREKQNSTWQAEVDRRAQAAAQIVELMRNIGS